jgi:hypothetical protein
MRGQGTSPGVQLRMLAGYVGGGASADLASGIEAIRSATAQHGRSRDKLDFTVLTGYEMAPAGGLEARIRELLKLGFNRVVFLVPPAAPDEQRPKLDRYTALIRKFD